jgi:hypothetical protein
VFARYIDFYLKSDNFPPLRGRRGLGENLSMCRSTIGQLSRRESVRLSVLVLRRGDSDQL